MTDADPALAEARARFDRGDFRGARRALDARTDEEARAFLARLAPDPWATRFGALALVALAAAAIIYLR